MKILLITSYFPSFDIQYNDPRTKFLYYYASEWIKQGHEVLVLHSLPRYPRVFSLAINLLEERLGFKSLQLSRFRQNSEAVQAAAYEVDGIKVIRTPIRKLIPHRDFLPWDLSQHRKNVLKSYKESGFQADIVISDFLIPSVYIADDIRRCNRTPFYQVIHQSDFGYLKSNSSLRKALSQASGILFRSYSHTQWLKQKGFVPAYEDYIFTGVPDDTQMGKPRTSVKKLLFAGSLRVTKNIHIILEAIAVSRGRTHYELEIIGDGPYEERLRALTVELGLQKQVVFSGRLSREKVFEKMRLADCLIMVSKETYGMVYIEAISQGCIAVAAKNQGVDGIIINCENGFLVECGNVKELTELLDILIQMDKQEILRISENGIQTARQMTDGQLAKDLLERLNAHLTHNRESIGNR
jgi:glycosyltransferase involved in cell wall biosynthesis